MARLREVLSVNASLSNRNLEADPIPRAVAEVILDDGIHRCYFFEEITLSRSKAPPRQEVWVECGLSPARREIGYVEALNQIGPALFHGRFHP